MKNENWILCPLCRGKTRLKLREDTELKKLSVVLIQSANKKL